MEGEGLGSGVADEAHGEGEFGGMEGAEAAGEHGGIPGEVVHEDVGLGLGEFAFGLTDGFAADVAIGGEAEPAVGGGVVGVFAAVGGEEGIDLVGSEFGFENTVAEGGGGEAVEGVIFERAEGGFVLAAADEERDAGGGGGRLGVPGLLGDGAAVDYGGKLAVVGGLPEVERREVAELGGLVGGEAEFREQGASGEGRVFAGGDFKERAAFEDGFVEQASGGGHGEEGADFGGAAGFAEDGDVGGVAAEVGNVGADPLEGGDEVELTDVAGGELGVKVAEEEVAEDVDAVVDADEDDVLFEGEAVGEEGEMGGAGDEAAAVDIDHDGAFAAGGRG